MGKNIHKQRQREKKKLKARSNEKSEVSMSPMWQGKWVVVCEGATMNGMREAGYKRV